VFSTVDIDGSLAGLVLVLLAQGTVLGALISVEEDTVEHDIEVLQHAGDDLVENVHVDAVVGALGFLLIAPVLKDPADGLRGGQGHDAAILSDTFPVIDKERLQVVGHHDANRGAGVEAFFLFKAVNMRVITSGAVVLEVKHGFKVIGGFRQVLQIRGIIVFETFDVFGIEPSDLDASHGDAVIERPDGRQRVDERWCKRRR